MLARLSTTATSSASGLRAVTFDNVMRQDEGWIADPGAGTITVPQDGWYVLSGHVHYSTSVITRTALTIRTGDSSVLLRSARGNYDANETDVAGVAYLTAGTVLSLWIDSTSSVALVGIASGSYVNLRAVLVEAGAGVLGGRVFVQPTEPTGLQPNDVWIW